MKKDPGPGEIKLYLVDASSYAFRAYHATAHQRLTNSRGLPTGAVMVFINMLKKLLREEKPTHVVVVWDPPGKTFRHDLYPEYKANRVATPPDLKVQIGYMRKLVEALRLPAREFPGFEADDVIGTIARRAEAQGIETVIVSGDKDLTQLIGDKVTMLDTLKDVRIDAEKVKERFGVEPGRVIEVLGLMGDSSDNVPGVPKVGEKTAIKLIAQFGTLEDTLTRVDEVKGKIAENLRAFADQARFSRELVIVHTDLPLKFEWDEFIPPEPDLDALGEVLGELELKKLMQEFGVARVTKETIDRDGYRLIDNLKDLDRFLETAKKKGRLAIDTETTSLDAVRADLIGVSMAVEEGKAVYLPIAHTGDGAEQNLDWEKTSAALAPVLTDVKISKIGQNLKYDLIVLERAGAVVDGVAFDSMVASYLLNPKRRSHKLDDLADEFLGHKMISYEDLCGKGKNQTPFARVPVAAAMRYSAEDSDAALRLANLFAPKLKEGNLEYLFNEIEMPLVPVLARMEATGVKVDTEKLAALSRNFTKQIDKIKLAIFEICGKQFNLDSPKQLAEVLFVKLGLPAGKKTKTGFSTSQEVLEKLAEEHEVAQKILDYRSLAKLKNTYTDALPELVNLETGRLHTSYNQTVTSTGRLSSSDPNLQNIPVRTPEGREIREAFVGEGKNLIMSADYSQIELRLVAHLSEEPTLLDSFQKGEDIHARTASEVFGMPLAQVTSDYRRRAKVINFGILYGMSAHGLTRQLDVDHKQAQAYLDAYFARYPYIRKYMESTVEFAKKHGYVETIKGRKMPLTDIEASNFVVRLAAEREAINAPLQGSAADIIKIAMIAVDREMRKQKFKSKMIMQVHDELVFEAVPAELGELKDMVIKKMESAVKLKVALKVDVSEGAHWAEAH